MSGFCKRSSIIFDACGLKPFENRTKIRYSDESRIRLSGIQMVTVHNSVKIAYSNFTPPPMDCVGCVVCIYVFSMSCTCRNYLEAAPDVVAPPVALSFCFDLAMEVSDSSGKLIIHDCSTMAATRFSYSRRFSWKKLRSPCLKRKLRCFLLGGGETGSMYVQS